MAGALERATGAGAEATGGRSTVCPGAEAARAAAAAPAAALGAGCAAASCLGAGATPEEPAKRCIRRVSFTS
jgi:hypothetical protein